MQLKASDWFLSDGDIDTKRELCVYTETCSEPLPKI